MSNTKAKVALVTGAGVGIGRAIAKRLAEMGCTVGVLDNVAESAKATENLIIDTHGSAIALVADVVSPAQLQDAVRELENKAGPVDVLVNNAGIARVGSLTEMSYQDWALQFQVNVDGPFHCCQIVVPGMVERGYGRVINLSSWFAKSAVPNYGGYCATKAAILAFTRSLALEVAKAGVTVNAICPGTIVNTRMREEVDKRNRQLGNPTAAERESTIPLGRVGQPEDIAGVAGFLISPEADYMTGQGINVTGGLWMT